MIVDNRGPTRSIIVVIRMIIHVNSVGGTTGVDTTEGC
jgi:hypothetical protein